MASHGSPRTGWLRRLGLAGTDKGFAPWTPGVPTTAPARRRARGDAHEDHPHPVGRTRLAAGIVTAGLLVGLAACSSADDGGDDGAGRHRRPRRDRRRHHAHAVDPRTAGEAGQAAGRRRTTTSHENQVELTVVPNDDYVAKVGAAAGSDGLPDLFAADIVYVPNWVQQGLFQDLTAQIDGLSFKDEINKGHLAAGTADGKEHVLPFVLDLSMLFWNKDLFAEAGLDPEKAPANLTEYAEAAKAVQALNKPDTYGTATGLNCGGCLVFTWFPSVWADGEQVMNEDGTESLLEQRHGQGDLLAPGRTCGTPARCSRRPRTRPARRGPPASPRARSA